MGGELSNDAIPALTAGRGDINNVVGFKLEFEFNTIAGIILRIKLINVGDFSRIVASLQWSE
jgi:zona occludens toxin (predicted ATPase)